MAAREELATMSGTIGSPSWQTGLNQERPGNGSGYLVVASHRPVLVWWMLRSAFSESGRRPASSEPPSNRRPRRHDGSVLCRQTSRHPAPSGSPPTYRRESDPGTSTPPCRPPGVHVLVGREEGHGPAFLAGGRG
jgi:hypothetical protein